MKAITYTNITPTIVIFALLLSLTTLGLAEDPNDGIYQQIPSPLLEELNHQLRDRTDIDYTMIPLSDMKRIADNLVAKQNSDGGWKKNLHWRRTYTPEEIAKFKDVDKRSARSTLDNGSGTTHVLYLAQCYQKTKDKQYARASLKGIQWIISTQHKTSEGWRGYDVDAVTFNDNVMVNVLELLMLIEQDKKLLDFLDNQQREDVNAAYKKGLACVLRLAIKVDDKRIGWAQQYSHQSGQPVKARTYEHPALSARETTDVLRMLMRIPDP